MNGREVRILAAGMVVLAALGVGVTAAARAFLVAPPEDAVSVELPESLEPQPQAAWPSRIRIDAIELDATVQHTGITKEGNMAVPESYSDAGWYRYGVPPGSRGSAVIGGHFDNGAGLPAVFGRLSELEEGDTITILTQEGEEVQFVVRRVARYALADVPMEEIFAQTSEVRLNLITCSGTWLSEGKTYDERFVVYAVRA